MSTRVAINGLGRIGRAILKLVLDEPSLELVAVNDLVDVDNLAYLLRFDTVYGRYSKPVVVDGHDLVVAGRKLRTLRNRDPLELPWKELDVELVFECTGALTRRVDLEKHVRAGAQIVLLSAPSKGGEVETVVHGANMPGGTPAIISCASCTTNCITPIVEVIGRRIGFEKAVMTTVHAYTSSQSVVDGPSKGFRRGRAAAANLVPATTGAALATTRALPEYAGLFDGIAIRAPIAVGSIADITFVTSRKTTVEEVNQILAEEGETERYAGVLGVSRDPLVSSDIVGDPRASIVDLELTRVIDGDLVKIMSWYDNEWGYANQMLRQAVSMTQTAAGARRQVSGLSPAPAGSGEGARDKGRLGARGLADQVGRSVSRVREQCVAGIGILGHGRVMLARVARAALVAGLALSISGCDYLRLLRPNVLKQLNPDVVRMLNELPEVDDPNEAIVARLFAHGGLSHAKLGGDGIFRDEIRVPKHEYIWRPAIIVMRHGGELEVDFANEDEALHIAFMPSNDNRRVLELPVKQRGTVRVRLDAPGLYWFGCPVSNHAGRGMLGLVLVKGEVPAEARLDRPRMRRP